MAFWARRSVLMFLLMAPQLSIGDDHDRKHHHEGIAHGDEHHDEHHHDEHHDDHHHEAHQDEHHHDEHHYDHHHDEHHHDDHHHNEHHDDHHHNDHHHDDHHDEHHLDRKAKPVGHKKFDGWMGAYLSAIGMSLVSFVGILFLAVFGGYGRIEAMAEYVCLAFAGSVLVADALLHLLPHAFEGASHDAMTKSGVAAVVGALMVLVVPEMCSHGHHGEGNHDDEVKASGWANLLVEMLHNFVDGISIGLSWMAGTPAGLSASIAVAVHELPQELGDFVVLRAAGFSTKRLLFWNFLASLTCVGGVGVAHFFGQEASQQLQRTLMAFTAGSFLTLALNMIFPQVSESIRHHHKGTSAVLAKLLCLSVSCVAVVLLIKIGSLEGHEHDDGHAHGHSHGHSHGHAHGEL